MNVLRNPVHVIKTLNAQIVMDPTAVLVNRDSLEMAQHVQVSNDNVSKSHWKKSYIKNSTINFPS